MNGLIKCSGSEKETLFHSVKRYIDNKRLQKMQFQLHKEIYPNLGIDYKKVIKRERTTFKNRGL
ncbi:MAG: hypothetical protein AB1297_00420, partial [bacterium]